MGQPELGVKEMEAAHRRDPGNLKVADALAQYYDEVGLGTRAQQIYQEALALDPDNPALANNLCFSYYQAGNWSQAETCYRQTLARQPNNKAARNNLGLVLCRQGRQEEARRLWQEAEGEAGAAQKLGEALAALGMAPEPLYAQQSRPHPGERVNRPHPSPGRLPTANPEAAAPPATHSPAPAPAVSQQVGAGPGAEAPSPAVAAAKPAATPPKPKASGTPVQKPLASLPPTDRVTAAPPEPPQDVPGQIADQKPDGASPSRKSTPAVAPPFPAPGTATPAKSKPTTSQAGSAVQSEPHRTLAATSQGKPESNRRAFLTARELVETNIAILNGNGIPHLAHKTRSQLSLEGFNVVAIGNFKDFGVDRTVIYYRPDSEPLATALGNKFFPRAEVKPEPHLPGKVDVKVVLGHDLHPQQYAGALKTQENQSL
jgi:hypothetical protein